MKLTHKLPLAFAAVLFFVVCAALYGIYSLNQSVSIYQNSVAQSNQHERDMSDVALAFKTQVQEWKNTLLRGSQPEQLNKYWQAFTQQESQVADKVKKLATTLPEGESKRLLGQFIQAHAQMGLDYRKGLEAFKAANFEITAGDASVKGMDREPGKLLEAADVRIAADSAATSVRAAADARQATLIRLGLMLLMSGAGIVVGLVISRQVINQLGGEPQSAVDLTQRVASGDLSQPITLRQGDTSSLMAQLDAMQASLVQVVRRVGQGAQTVENTSSEIAQGNLDMSDRTESQAHALEKTASAISILAVAVKQNADSAQQANRLAVEASSIAVRGGAAVAEVVDTMRGINDASRKIADIIAVIDGIAFQTNILALNAAVEAARAGEQGRGFAVVASEVRSLAGRSAEAAKEIKNLISASVNRVEQGTAQVDRAGATMNEVVSAIHRVTDIMGQISTESNEQAASVAHVGQNVTEMSQTTQQNSAMVEQMAAAAGHLKEQAQELVGTVAIFNLGQAQAPKLPSPAMHQLARPSAAGHKPASHALAAPTKKTAVNAQPKSLSPPKPAPTPTAAAAKASSDSDWETF